MRRLADLECYLLSGVDASGEAVQVDSIKTRFQSAYGFSA
jgi:hypothetical protein